jgi:adenylate cyclase
LSDEDHRFLTLLFVDVPAFAGLGARLDPEVTHQVLGDYFQQVSEVLRRHGGTVDKFVGDAVFAVFGAPTPQEDHADRALAAGLELLDVVAKYGETVRAHTRAYAQARVGINSGSVSWGGVGRGEVDGNLTVVGDAVNVASRLQNATSPGTVLLGESARNALTRSWNVKAVPPIRVKGKAEPLIVFRVLPTAD